MTTSSCHSCASVVPAAAICPGCGAPVHPGAHPAGADLSASELCEIMWWRGYVKSEFYARAVNPLRGEYEAARSRSFWWSRRDPPPAERKGAKKAHAKLVQQLLADGWEATGESARWYGTRFQRPLAGIEALLAREGASNGAVPENGTVSPSTDSRVVGAPVGRDSASKTVSSTPDD